MVILDEIPLGTSGWNAIMTTNFQKIEVGILAFLRDLISASAEVIITSTDNTDGTTVLVVKNSDGTTLFTILADGTVRIGTTADYTQIEPDGHLSYVGEATRWEDLRFPAIATKLGGTKDPGFAKFKDNGSGSQGVFTYFFDSDTEEELYFVAQMPHQWKLESTIYPHVHWSPKTSSDGNPADQLVRWGLEYTLAKIGGSFGNTSIIYGSAHYPADADVVAGDHYLTSLTPISMAGIDEVSSMLICRIFRDATHGDDNYEHDAGLLEIDFHYEVDTPGGSKEELSKN
jgi:hypothetical protein